MKNREKAITNTSLVGIGANVALAALKAVFGAIAGSVAVIMDGVNNLSDALSSVVTLAGVKLAKRKPNTKHPFGYGRIEYFSAIIVAAIVLVAGVTALVEAIKSFFTKSVPEYSAYTFAIIAIAVAVKIALGLFFKKQGEKYNSDALAASGKDALFDAVLSFSTIVGGVVAAFAGVSIDGVLGVIISFFIIKAGIEMLLESVDHIIGNRPDSEISREIKAKIGSIEGVLGAYDLVLHNYGPDRAIGSVHIEVPSTLNANEIHRLTQKVQKTVFEEFSVFLTVGIYSYDQAKNELRDHIFEITKKHEGVLGAHAFFLNEEEKFLSLDVLVDFSIADKDAFAEQLKKEYAELLPGYTFRVNFDVNYSD